MAGLSTGQFQRVIKEYFDDCELDVICRKKRRGYSLCLTDDDDPFARLCPTGEDDEVEINWWDGSHWQPVEEFGVTLPLSEALEYVMEDSDGVFFGEGEEQHWEGDVDQSDILDWALSGAFQPLLPRIISHSLFGAVCGGFAVSAHWGAMCGSGAALAITLSHIMLRNRFQHIRFLLLFDGLPSMALAGASGAVGASVGHGLGGGLWPTIAGACVSLACAFLCLIGRRVSWLVGFTAGLNLGIWLAEALKIREQFLGAIAMALFAAIAASLLGKLGSLVHIAMEDALKANSAER